MEQEVYLIKNISDFLYPYKQTPKNSVQKNLKKFYLRELHKRRPDRVEEKELTTKLIEWLQGLDYNTKAQVLTHKNQFLASILQEMYFVKLRSGQKVFKILALKDKTQQDYSLSGLFTSRSKNMKELTHESNNREKEFENLLRFCDKDCYCDCISLDPSISIEEFLSRINQITENKTFMVPCRVSWDSMSNMWSWDYPAWFSQDCYFSMAAVACASFERAIWIQFWNAHDLDPRVPQEMMVYKKDYEKLEYSVSEIMNFVEGLEENQRRNIVGDVGKHNEICRIAKTQIKTARNPNQNTLFENETPLARFPDESLCFKNIESISKLLSRGDMKKLTESLYFSSLDKLSTLTNIIYRKILINILTALAAQQAENLIKNEKICEKNDKPQHPIKKKNKKKYKKKDKKIPPNEEFYKEIASDLLYKVIGELEEKPEFQMDKSFDTGKFDQISVNKPGNLSIKTCMGNDNKMQNKQKGGNTRNGGYTNGQKKQYYRKDCYKKQTKRPHSSNTAKKPLDSDHSTPLCNTAKTSHEVTPTKPEGNRHKFQWWNVPENKTTTPLDNYDFPPLSACQDTTILFTSLHHEILRFTVNMTKKVQEKYNSFLPTFNEIISIIKQIHPDASLVLYGSYGTNLALDTSDIDIVLNLNTLPSRSEIQDFCQHLQEAFQTLNKILNIQAITTARIPVVKLKTENYNLDITYEDEKMSHQGIYALNLTRNFIYACPLLREITLVVKKLLYTNQLNSSYHGGLNSYGLFLWIVAFFNSLPCREQDLGKLLMMFLDYYGNHFNPINTGISVVNGGSTYPLLYCCYENAVTIDPLTRANLTGNLYRIKEIQKLFSDTHMNGFNKKFWKT